MTATKLGLSRRDALGAVGAAAGFSALGGLPDEVLAAARSPQIAGYVPGNVVPAKTLGGWLKQLHDFGPIRATGTRQCRAFEEFLASEFGKLGCTVLRDQFRLTSWECDLAADCEITIREDSGAARKLEVVAYYPFAGSTRGKAPVSGRLLYGGVGDKSGESIVAKYSPQELAEAIVVVEMPLAGGGVRGKVQYYPGATYPDPLPPPQTTPNPAAQGGTGVMRVLENRCKGLIFCYTDVSNEAVRYNYLPFSDQHRKIPALWIGAEDTRYLKTVAGKATAILRADAKLTANARADSLLAVMKGPSDEVVYMTTQTDGPNECNENGALGLLASATYMARQKDRRRTLVFSLPTGHYAAGAVRDPVTGSGRPAGTTGNIAKWPQYIEKAVAQIALEQMAAMEWLDVDGRWQATGRVCPENWIPTPGVAETVNRLFLAAAAGEDPKFSRSGLVESGQAPGEGGALRNRGIPGVGLMGSPNYFFRCDPKGVLEKLSPQVMHNQVSIVAKLLVLFDRLTPDQLHGKAPTTARDLYG
jgi:hypothetical protein